jgi:hypothetical protein
MRLPFLSKRRALLLLLAVVAVGCGGKTIANLGGIRGTTDFRVDGIIVNMALLTDTGDRLTWDASIISPVGGGVLDPLELDTHVKVYSTLNGQRHNEVYSGRLKRLNWDTQGNARYGGLTFRSLFGLVSIFLIKADPTADSPLGELEVTLITPKQGEFHTTIYDAQIYPASFF